MGYSETSQPVGKEGLWVGTKGSEVQVADEAGHIFVAGTELASTAAEIDKACDLSAKDQAMIASGAVTAGVQHLTLDHTSITIAATIADVTAHQGFFLVEAITEPGGSGDHTLTLTGGTFNGTNTIATFADVSDALLVYFNSAGRGTILVNTGSVALSGP